MGVNVMCPTKPTHLELTVEKVLYIRGIAAITASDNNGALSTVLRFVENVDDVEEGDLLKVGGIICVEVSYSP